MKSSLFFSTCIAFISMLSAFERPPLMPTSSKPTNIALSYVKQLEAETIYFRQIILINELVQYLSKLNPRNLTRAIRQIPHALTLVSYIPTPIEVRFAKTPKHALTLPWAKNIELTILSALLCELASMKNADKNHFEIVRFLLARGACCVGDRDINPIQKAFYARNMDIFCLLAAHNPEETRANFPA